MLISRFIWRGVTMGNWSLAREQVEKAIASLVEGKQYQKAAAICQFFREETGLDIDPIQVLAKAGGNVTPEAPPAEVEEPPPAKPSVAFPVPFAGRKPLFKISQAGHLTIYWPNQKYPTTIFVQNLEWLFSGTENMELPPNLAMLRDYFVENHHRLTRPENAARPTKDAAKTPPSELLAVVAS